MLVLRPGAEEDDSFSGDDDDDEDEEHEDRETDAATEKKNTLPSTNLSRSSARWARLGAALEDIFAPRSPRAAVQNRASFGGSLLVLNVNSATRKGALRIFSFS